MVRSIFYYSVQLKQDKQTTDVSDKNIGSDKLPEHRLLVLTES